MSFDPQFPTSLTLASVPHMGMGPSFSTLPAGLAVFLPIVHSQYTLDNHIIRFRVHPRFGLLLKIGSLGIAFVPSIMDAPHGLGEHLDSLIGNGSPGGQLYLATCGRRCIPFQVHWAWENANTIHKSSSTGILN
jgi:hypothetical protein